MRNIIDRAIRPNNVDLRFSNEVISRRKTELDGHPYGLQHIWYEMHRLMPDFDHDFDPNKSAFEDGSKPQRRRTTLETLERAKVYRNWIVGDMAIFLEQVRLRSDNRFQTLEALTHDCYRYFLHGQTAMLMKDANINTPRERVKTFNLFDVVLGTQNFMYWEKVDMDVVHYDLVKRDAWLKEMLISKERYEEIKKLAKIIESDDMQFRGKTWELKGIVYCHFPKLWMPEEPASTHELVMTNTKEMLKEAMDWAGFDSEETMRRINNLKVKE